METPLLCDGDGRFVGACGRKRRRTPGVHRNALSDHELWCPSPAVRVAEHKVELPGGDAASQCDVWALLKTSAGTLSLSVEAKAGEPFGDATLKDWLVAGGTDQSVANRKRRWDYIRTNLPESASYDRVRYQLLHRCAAAVIEARRFDLQHAAFIVQAFNTPDKSFRDYEEFCHAMGFRQHEEAWPQRLSEA